MSWSGRDAATVSPLVTNDQMVSAGCGLRAKVHSARCRRRIGQRDDDHGVVSQWLNPRLGPGGSARPTFVPGGEATPICAATRDQAGATYGAAGRRRPPVPQTLDRSWGAAMVVSGASISAVEGASQRRPEPANSKKSECRSALTRPPNTSGIPAREVAAPDVQPRRGPRHSRTERSLISRDCAPSASNRQPSSAPSWPAPGRALFRGSRGLAEVHAASPARRMVQSGARSSLLELEAVSKRVERVEPAHAW
jgi:hypothetical protein